MLTTESQPQRHKLFLYSSITRPGNSGGPIVAQDGRVIGLVVDDSEPANSAGARDSEADQDQDDETKPALPFFRGIPASEVLRGRTDLGFRDLVVFDD